MVCISSILRVIFNEDRMNALWLRMFRGKNSSILYILFIYRIIIDRMNALCLKIEYLK